MKNNKFPRLLPSPGKYKNKTYNNQGSRWGFVAKREKIHENQQQKPGKLQQPG